MSRFYDDLETRNADRRAEDLARTLPAQIANAKANTVLFGERLKEVDAAALAVAEYPEQVVRILRYVLEGAI